MMRSFRVAFVVSVFAVIPGMRAASAQEAAVAPAIAPADCPKPPGDIPVKAPKADMTRFQKQVDDYKACVDAYAQTNMTKAKDLQAQAMDLQSQAQARQAQAQSYATAANGAIEEFNAYAIDLKRRAEAGKK